MENENKCKFCHRIISDRSVCSECESVKGKYGLDRFLERSETISQKSVVEETRRRYVLVCESIKSEMRNVANGKYLLRQNIYANEDIIASIKVPFTGSIKITESDLTPTLNFHE